jgi:uncharacterized protein (DUF2147 family)
MKKLFFTLIFSLLSLSFLAAQDITKGLWYNAEKTSKVQFYEVNGKIFGKVVWLKEPEREGKPRTDVNNPNKKLQTTPLIGLIFMKNFEKVSEKKWENGSIYDPTNGKTYSCIITQASPTVLDVRGYIGISLIGRTSKFTRAD